MLKFKDAMYNLKKKLEPLQIGRDFTQEYTFTFWPFILFMIGIEVFCVAGVFLAMTLIPVNKQYSHPVLVYGIGTIVGLGMIIFAFGKARVKKIRNKPKVKEKLSDEAQLFSAKR